MLIYDFNRTTFLFVNWINNKFISNSDGVVRIFTQDENRFANEETVKTFEEEVNAITRQSCQEIGGVKVSEYVPNNQH